MKLHDLLKRIDFLENVRIFIIEDQSDDAEDDIPTFVGSVMDVPWTYLEMKIPENGDFGSIYTNVIKNIVYLDVYVTELN